MLPTDRPLNPAEIEQVARDFGRWIKERRWSLTAISKKLGEGFSPSLLSQFKDGLYKGDQERVARAVNELMEREERRREVPPPKGFVETEVARRIMTVCRTAIDTCGIGVVYGPSGAGKTLTLETVHSQVAGSIYHRVTQATTRAPGLVYAIASLLGLTRLTSLQQMQPRVINTLKGTGRPIFIDEAQQLGDTGMLAVRDIHDAAGVPIVLVGTIDVRKKVDDSQQWYGQMASRVIATCDITEFALRPKNPRPLFTPEEIREVFAGERLRLTDDGADFLTTIACVPGAGGLRVVKQIVLIASRLPKFRDKALDASILRQVAKQMHGAAYLEVLRERAERLRLAKVG